VLVAVAVYMVVIVVVTVTVVLVIRGNAASSGYVRDLGSRRFENENISNGSTAPLTPSHSIGNRLLE